MILTKNSLRDLKTALMAIPGHPGSSRISEALARGFGFDDYHALKTQFDAYEESLDQMPAEVNFDTEAFVAFMRNEDRQTVLDMAITAQYLTEGDYFIEDMENYPELHGGRVILSSLASKGWAAAAQDYIKRTGEILTNPRWALQVKPIYWVKALDDYTGSGADSFFIHDGNVGLRQPTEAEWEETVEHYNDTKIDITSFLDSTFFRFRDLIPQNARRTVHHLAVDGQGVRIVHSGEGNTVEAWILMQNEMRAPR